MSSGSVTLDLIYVHLVTYFLLNSFLGCFQLNGQDISLPTSSPSFSISSGFDSEDHGVSPSLQFTCSGRIDSWEAYFEKDGTYPSIKFQVWRPVQDPSGCTTYDLVGTNSFTDQTVDTTLRSQFVPAPGSIIEFEMGDVVGFYADYRGRAQVSFQINPAALPSSVTYYDVSLTSQAVDGLATLSSCGLTVSSSVPLLTAMVTKGKAE